MAELRQTNSGGMSTASSSTSSYTFKDRLGLTVYTFETSERVGPTRLVRVSVKPIGASTTRQCLGTSHVK